MPYTKEQIKAVLITVDAGYGGVEAEILASALRASEAEQSRLVGLFDAESELRRKAEARAELWNRHYTEAMDILPNYYSTKHMKERHERERKELEK